MSKRKNKGKGARSVNARKGTRQVAKKLTPVTLGRRAAAPRLNVDERAELYRLRDQVRRCRVVMEANDPGNALDIFGPPKSHPQSGSADAEGGTPGAPPSILEEAERLGSTPEPYDLPDGSPNPNAPDTVYS